jgi:hypothetical protein
MWKEVVVALIDAVFRPFIEGTEKYHKHTQSW